MLTLYHHPICPFSRFIRVFLKELDLEFKLERVEYWLRPQEFLRMNPACEVPVLSDATRRFFADIYAIVEYLIELHPQFHLYPSSLEGRAEMRRLVSWSMGKFYREVTKYIIEEKFLRLISKSSSPRPEFIRAAKVNLGYHISYFSHLIRVKGYVASEHLTLADIALATQISVLDYFGDMNWNFVDDDGEDENIRKYKSYSLEPENNSIKSWYMIIKSRPSFRPLLQDSISVIAPPAHYTQLDF